MVTDLATSSATLSSSRAAITGQTALASGLASTDELVLSDGGVIKRMDISVIEAYMQSNLAFGGGQINHKTADESVTSSDALQDDNHLVGYTLEAGEYYSIEGYFAWDQNVGNIKFFLDFDNQPQVLEWNVIASAANGVRDSDHTSSVVGVLLLASLTDGQSASGHVKGGFQAHATTGGTVDLQWAQQISSGNSTTMLDSSWLKITKVS